MKTTAGSAAGLLGDALDLRHRLPATWVAVRAGQGPVYQARRVAYTTRHLTKAQAGEVDARIAPRLGRVSFGRLQSLLEAFVPEADPDGADAAAEAVAQERFVRLGRTSEHGLRFVMARVAAGDAVWGFALTNRLAEILRREGDVDSVDVRRSKAFGLQLTQPAEVLRLLCTHQDNEENDSDERDEFVDEPADVCPEPAEEPEPMDWSREPDQEPEFDEGCPEPVEGPTSPDPSPAVGAAAVRPGQGPAPPSSTCTSARWPYRPGGGSRGWRTLVRYWSPGCDTWWERPTQILLKPVIDLNDVPAPVDSYEIPDVIREHLRLRQPVDVFPYAAGTGRRMDLDHSLRYVPPSTAGRRAKPA